MSAITTVPTRRTGGAPRLPAGVYRRRRVGVATFALTLVVSSGFAAHDGLADRGGDPASAPAVGRAPSYVVQPGDTLWSIAERLAPNGSLTDYVDVLVGVNGGASIVPGQVLRLP